MSFASPSYVSCSYTQIISPSSQPRKGIRMKNSLFLYSPKERRKIASVWRDCLRLRPNTGLKYVCLQSVLAAVLQLWGSTSWKQSAWKLMLWDWLCCNWSWYFHFLVLCLLFSARIAPPISYPPTVNFRHGTCTVASGNLNHLLGWIWPQREFPFSHFSNFE